MKYLVYWCGIIVLLTGCRSNHHYRPRILVEDLVLQFRSNDSFKGIFEAFRHKETQLGRVVLRSDPDKRDGLYFIIKFNNGLSLLSEGTRIQITFITDRSPKDQVRIWIMPKMKHSVHWQNELWLGMTDEEAKKNFSTNLIAWKVDVLAPDGKCLATKQSYAW